MDYRRVSDRVRSWSPFSHGWFCDSCPQVCVLDGDIEEGKNEGFRVLERQMRINLFSAIWKTSFKDKSKPENLDIKLENKTPERKPNGVDKKLDKYIDAVIRETKRIRPLEPEVSAPEEEISLTPYEE